MFLKFSDQFYPDVVYCSVETGEKAFYDIAFKKDTEDSVLGVLVTGPSADAYTALASEAEIIDTVLAELDVIFDGAASTNYLGEYRIEKWGERPYTQGTWVEGFRLKENQNLNEPLDGRVYFAGEV